MTTDWKALCAELVNSWAEGLDIVGPMHRARIALDQPEPEGPTDDDLHDLWLELYGLHDGPTSGDVAVIARTVLARWGRPVTTQENSND